LAGSACSGDIADAGIDGCSHHSGGLFLSSVGGGCRLPVFGKTSRLFNLNSANLGGCMAAVKSYRDLETWKKAMDLVQEIYLETKSFPKEETYGLLSQMRRAAVSIPSNIAEGQGRDSTKEFLHHLSIAYGRCVNLKLKCLFPVGLDILVSKSTTVYLIHRLALGD
jgi:four helix bundle protein